MNTWIGLGSNIGDGPEMIGDALCRIHELDGVRIIRRSGLYGSEPWGYGRQAEFTNAVAELDCRLAPLELLEELTNIENAMGRRRGSRRWGPRCIDLDVLLIGGRILVLENPIVLHPRMHLRAFVLLPLAELEPGLVIPGRGTVRSCLARTSGQRISKMNNGAGADD